MKSVCVSIILSLISLFTFSQIKKERKVGPPATTINLLDSSIKDFNPSLIHLDSHPIPSAEYGQKKELLHQKRMQHKSQIQTTVQKATRAEAIDPIIVRGFQGNAANGSPNDNDIAVSNDGKVVSVVNSNMRVYNDTGKSLLLKSISVMVNQVGVFSHISDPRVIYDAKNDRFIMVCFSGNLSNESVILVGFTQSNKPDSTWNFYKLNGNSFNDSTWSDYPIIAISDKDLFITFNQVKDNVSWTVGFQQSVIWQVDKQSGYNGDSLKYDLWSDIKYEGNYLRNICPAKYQTTEMGDNMYFLTVRNVADENDSIFVNEITNSYESDLATMKQRVMTLPMKYGFPPNAIQKKVGNVTNQLMTNDARVLAAIYENDQIHFGANSLNTEFMNAGVYLGSIKNVSTSTPTLTGKIFSTETTEYGYPSMAYMGHSKDDHRVLYTFSYCITDSFPGTSIIYKNALDNFSNIISVKEGISVIDRFTDSVERWGDYTNIQTLYNNRNRAYLAGSWGKSSIMNTWINLIEINDSTKLPTPAITHDNVIYPNPIVNNFSFQFNMDKAEKVTFEILDMTGKRVALLMETNTKIGKNEFSFNSSSLPKSNYIFKMSSKEKIIASHKILVQ